MYRVFKMKTEYAASFETKEEADRFVESLPLTYFYEGDEDGWRYLYFGKPD